MALYMYVLNLKHNTSTKTGEDESKEIYSSVLREKSIVFNAFIIKEQRIKIT